jgi:hypothetical protein
VRLLFWWGVFFVLGFALIAFAAPATEASPAFVVLLLVLTLFFALGVHSFSQPKWYLRRDGRESGPLSAREIGALQQSGQLGAGAEIRSRWGSEWHPFVVTAMTPNRADPALLFGLLGLAIGFGASYGLFGRVDGHWLPLEWIAEMPQQDRFLKVAWGVSNAVPNPVSGLTSMAQAEVDRVLAQIERSRYLIIGITAGLGILAAAIASAMAPPRHRIVTERAVAARR